MVTYHIGNGVPRSRYKIGLIIPVRDHLFIHDTDELHSKG